MPLVGFTGTNPLGGKTQILQCVLALVKEDGKYSTSFPKSVLEADKQISIVLGRLRLGPLKWDNEPTKNNSRRQRYRGRSK